MIRPLPGPTSHENPREVIEIRGFEYIIRQRIEKTKHDRKAESDTKKKKKDAKGEHKRYNKINDTLTFCFEKPGSTTYTIPSIVSDVSATLVETTTFRPGGPPGNFGPGASRKIFCWDCGGSDEYRG